MKILFVSPYLPYPLDTGGKIRIFYLLKGLSKKFKIILITFINSPAERQYKNIFNKLCEKVILIEKRNYLLKFFYKLIHLFLPGPVGLLNLKSREFKQAVKRLKFEINEISLIHIEEECMFGFVKGFKKTLKVLSLCKIESAFLKQQSKYRRNLFYKLHFGLESIKYRHYEKKIFNRVSRIIVCSRPDREIVKKINLCQDPIIINNGADIEYYRPGKTVFSSYPKLLFIGTAAFPNIDGIVYFMNKIYPLVLKKNPDIKIKFIGQYPGHIKRKYALYPGIHFTGYVKDIRLYINTDSIFIVPLRVGGGTRIKILEAMAGGLPIVSTSVGCEGLDVRNGENILIADMENEFAEKINIFYKDRSLRKKLGVNGRKLAAKKYSWAEIGKQLAKNYANIMALHKKQKNKILVLNFGDRAHTFRGGQERNLFKVLNALKKEFSFTVALPGRGKFSEKLKSTGIETVILPVRGLKFFLGLSRLIRLILKEKYDIIQTNDSRSNLFGLLSLKLTGIGRLIAFRHDVYSNKETMPLLLLLKKILYRSIDRIIFKSYNRIIAVSHFISDELAGKLKVPKEKIKIIPYGIKINKFLKIPFKKPSKKEFIIGCIGRLEPIKKGQDLLIKAIPNIIKYYNNVKVLFIGDNKSNIKQKNKLINLAEKLDVKNNIKFIPFQKDITGILRKLDIVVQPSLYEGLPISIIESLCAGKAVIASDIGPINELIINGKNGFLVEPGNSKLLSEKILYLIRNKKNIKRISIEAKKNIKKFDINNNISLIRKLYNEI